MLVLIFHSASAASIEILLSNMENDTTALFQQISCVNTSKFILKSTLANSSCMQPPTSVSSLLSPPAGGNIS